MTKKMNIPFSPPDITEEEIQEVSSALKSGWITTGPRTKELERKIAEYVNVEKAVCLNSATAAMELTLRILGVGPGDEVITTAYTYTASASVINHVGATIVLVDTMPNSYEMDLESLNNKINEKTKAIISVDIAGIMANYEGLYSVIQRHTSIFKANSDLQDKLNRIAIISDAAHALGANQNGKMAGTVADFTCFSFHAVKNFTTAEGGAVVWRNDLGFDNDWLYQQYMLYSLHGQSKDALSKTQIGSWEYDIVYPGYKCNMTDILASIGLVQLERYSGMLARRKVMIEKYDEAMKEIGLTTLNHYDDHSNSSGHLYFIRIPNINEKQRNQIIIDLAEYGISTNVHYKPLPMMTAYKNLGFNIKDFPNAYDMYKNEITLPLHTLLSDDEINYVIEKVQEVVAKYI